jgi:tetratricopeptide (TPR) repeat protein
VVEAMEKNKQAKSSAAWFALARIYLYQGDLVGADSALRFAQEISPKCAGTLEGLPYQIWMPLVNAGVDFAKAQSNDSALAVFQQAAAIYPTSRPSCPRPRGSSCWALISHHRDLGQA